MENKPVDHSKIYLVAKSGDIVRKFDKGDGLHTKRLLLEFGNMFINEWADYDLDKPVIIVKNDTALGGFSDGIVAMSTKDGENTEILVMAFGLSIEDWDKFGAGSRVIAVQTLNTMKAAFATLDGTLHSTRAGLTSPEDALKVLEAVKTHVREELGKPIEAEKVVLH